MNLPLDVIDRYEALRERVLQPGHGGNQSWALLMRGGLLTWARACQERSPKEPIVPLGSAVEVIPDYLSKPLIQVLAGIVLHCQYEVADNV